MKKRILHIINSMTIGGAETLLANSLAPGGLNEYAENYLVYFKGESYLLDIIDKGVKIFCLDFKGGRDIFRVLKELNGIIKKNKIDIVHSHLNPADIYTHLVRPRNVKHVHTIHTTYSMDTETRPFLKSIEKKIYFESKNCRVICLSEFTKEDFFKKIRFKGKAFVLNNFVADQFFDNPAKKGREDGDPLRLVAIGSLKGLKNFEYLLDAFSYLNGDKIYLDIYGEGDKTKYENVINEKKLSIRMMGRHNDIASRLKEYDLFIMPSKYEGFPLSVFEAMASSLPLMLSNIAPLRSIVKDNAIYFDLTDAETTAATIRSIFHMGIDIDSLAKRSKEYAEKTVRRNIYIENLMEIYKQL